MRRQVGGEEGEDVGGLVGLLADGLADAVAGAGLAPQEDGVLVAASRRTYHDHGVFWPRRWPIAR